MYSIHYQSRLIFHQSQNMIHPICPSKQLIFTLATIGRQLCVMATMMVAIDDYDFPREDDLDN